MASANWPRRLLACHLTGLPNTYVAPLERVFVATSDSEQVEAEYLGELSTPRNDVAVLRVPGLALPAVQVGRMPERGEGFGYGFRPKTLSMEPEGHSFSGRYEPGQLLTVKASGSGRPRNGLMVPSTRRGEVRNFLTTLVEPGISGGPIYDQQLRRVVGLFRAVEGRAQAYVIPLDTVFEAWPDLEEENQATVQDSVLDTLAAVHKITLVSEGARPTRPIRHFRALFERLSVFGGRDEELRTLDDLVFAESGENCALVTGPAGFGKSTLLANWVRNADTAKIDMAVHFLSSEVETDPSERFLLENLCEQLMSIHGLGGELPDSLYRLRDLYGTLVSLPARPGRRQVIVIDGLDEGIGHWEQGTDLVPATFSPGTKLILSARTVADTDWIRWLRVARDKVKTIELGVLPADGVRQVLDRQAPEDLSAVERAVIARFLFDSSAGDPFYVGDLLEDLSEAGWRRDRLVPQPSSHSEYLRQWWSRADVRDEAFRQFMGILVVAKGPMLRAEIVNVILEGSLRNFNFPAVLASAMRYIVGDSSHGYALGHARIRDFIANELGADLESYRAAMWEYCTRWTTAGPIPDRYVLLHAVSHAMDAEPSARWNLFLDADWIAARWNRLGSFADLLRDVNELADRAFRGEPPDLPGICALALIRSTIRSMMSEIPPALILALARAGHVERAIGICRSAAPDNPRMDKLTFIVARELAEYLTKPRVSSGVAVGRDLAKALQDLAKYAYADTMDNDGPWWFSHRKASLTTRFLATYGANSSPGSEDIEAFDEARAEARSREEDLVLRALSASKWQGYAAERDPELQQQVHQFLAATDPSVASAAMATYFLSLDQDGARQHIQRFLRVSDNSEKGPFLALLLADVAGSIHWSPDDQDRIAALVTGAVLSGAPEDLVAAASAALVSEGVLEPDSAHRFVTALIGTAPSAAAMILGEIAREAPTGQVAVLQTGGSIESSMFLPWDLAAVFTALNRVDALTRLLDDLRPHAVAMAVLAVLRVLTQVDTSSETEATLVGQLLTTVLDRTGQPAGAEASGLSAVILMDRDRNRAMTFLKDALRDAILRPLDSAEFLRVFLVAALAATGQQEEALAEATTISTPQNALDALSAMRMVLPKPDPVLLSRIDAELSRLVLPSSEFDFRERVIDVAQAIERQGVQPVKTRAALVVGFEFMLNQMPAPVGDDALTRTARSLGYDNMVRLIRYFGAMAWVSDAARKGLDWVRQLSIYLDQAESIKLECLYAEAIGRYKPAEGESILQGFLIAPSRPVMQLRSLAEIAFAGSSALWFVRSDPATADRLTDLLLARLSTLSAPELRAVLPTIWTGWTQSGDMLDSLRNRERLKGELLFATRKVGNEVKADAIGNEVKADAIGNEVKADAIGNKVKADAIRALCASGDFEAAESLQAEMGGQADELRANLAFEIKSARERWELRKLAEERPFNALAQIYLRRDSTGLLAGLITGEQTGETSDSDGSILARALAQNLLAGGRMAMLEVGIWGLLYPAYTSGGPEAVRTIIESVENVDNSVTQTVNSRWWLDVAAPLSSPDDSRR